MPQAREACQLQPQFCLLPLLGPLQRCTCIGQFLCQCERNACLSYSRLGPEVRKDGLRQTGIIGGMPTPTLLLLSCCVQALQGIVPHQLQHAKAYRLTGRYLRLDKAGIHQGGQCEDAFFCRHLARAMPTASAASSVQPPTKTPSARKQRCCCSVSSS